MRKRTIVLFLLLFNLGLFGDSNGYKTYKMMIRDLKNVKTFGYRELSQSLSYTINTIGSSYSIGDKNCFMIWGKGFFKVYDKQRKRYLYTRYGLFQEEKNGLVTAEGYDLVTKMKITVEKELIVTLEDLLYQSYTNDGTIIDRESFRKRPFFFADKNLKGDLASSQKKLFFFKGGDSKKNEKRFTTREVLSCNLYLPKDESDFKLTENKRYFIFKNYRVIKNVKVDKYQLEASTVRVVHILPKVIKILEEKLKHNVKKKESILAKIRIFKMMLSQYKKYIYLNQQKNINWDFVPPLKIYWPFLERLD